MSRIMQLTPSLGITLLLSLSFRVQTQKKPLLSLLYDIQKFNEVLFFGFIRSIYVFKIYVGCLNKQSWYEPCWGGGEIVLEFRKTLLVYHFIVHSAARSCERNHLDPSF